MVTREVVLILGPPGSGKTTLARQVADRRDLMVWDRDDDQWQGSEYRFREAVASYCARPDARAVVVRTGLSEAARARAIRDCAPTEVRVMDTPRDVCLTRVRARGRGNVAGQVNAVNVWFGADTPTPPGPVPVETSPHW